VDAALLLAGSEPRCDKCQKEAYGRIND
jgi:hypothetical protein